MKKSFLLIIAAIGLSTSVKAQVAVASESKPEAPQAVVAPFLMEETEQNAIENVTGPMRSLENGIWYKRPAGTFLRTSKTYRYMILPPFTEVTFTNVSTNPQETVWKYGNLSSGNLTNYNESLIVDYNLVNSYNKNTGSGAYYGPMLCVEDVDTFGIIDSQLSSVHPLVVAPGDMTYMTHVPTTTTYTGWSNFKFGTNPNEKADRDGTTEEFYYDRFCEYIKAPAQPLYLESIEFYANLGEGKTVPVAEGSKGVMCYVIQAGDNAKVGSLPTYTDTVAVIPINPTYAEFGEYQEGKTTYVKAYCMEEDELGGMMPKPAIIEKDFVLVFEGFHNEGVDFGLTMSLLPEEEHYYNGGPYPTVYHQFWASDDSRKGSYWRYNSSSKYQYNMIVYLDGMFDVAALYDGETEFFAPGEGGSVYSIGEEDGEEVENEGVMIQTVFPYQSEESPMPSYSIEGMPDWLSMTDFNADYYDSSYGWVTVLKLQAESLPAGVEGREAKLRIVSEKGAKSQEFTVTQGAVGTGITEVTNGQTVTNNAAYNLSGQQVNDSYRGVVIKNGKKVVRK